MRKPLIALYLVCVVLFSVFFIPQTVTSSYGAVLAVEFKPIYWDPNQTTKESGAKWTENDFEKYDWYEPSDRAGYSQYGIVISEINLPRYFICVFIITTLFAAFYVLIPKKEKDHG